MSGHRTVGALAELGERRYYAGMSGSPDDVLSFLRAMRDEQNRKIDTILEGQRRLELRMGAFDRALRNTRGEASDATELMVDQQNQIQDIRDRLEHLETIGNVTPPSPRRP